MTRLDPLGMSENYQFGPGEIPRRPTPMGSLFGSGRLANRGDLRAFLDEPGSDALTFPDVALLTETHDEKAQLSPLLHQNLSFSNELRERHTLLVGATGVGKTQRWILPQIAADIADPQRAIIAIDAKGGVLHPFMSHLAAKYRPGQRVHQVNLRCPERNTTSWNPVADIRTRRDAHKVAYAVCVNSDLGIPPKDPFWINSSIDLLKDILFALTKSAEKDRSLRKAKELVDAFPEGLKSFIQKVGPIEDYPAIKRATDQPNQNPVTSIVADLAQRLLLFDDEGIVGSTCETNTLDFQDVIESGGMLVLEVCESDAAEITALTNLFVSQLFRSLMNLATKRPGGRLPRPTSLILDELGSACGVLPEFDKRLSTLRSRGVSITGAVQSISQLTNLYGQAAEPILGGFNTKVFFGGGLSLSDSEYASRLSGTMTGECVSYCDSDEDPYLGKTHTTRTRSPVARPVLLPDEISRPPHNRVLGSPATVFVPHLPPFYAYLPPAYENPELAEAQETIAFDLQFSE